MPFFGLEPFDTAKVTYVWMGVGGPGAFFVEVSGHVRKFTSHIELLRDKDFVGGLKIDVMGWTGPLAEPPSTTPYTVKASFKGLHVPKVVIHGSNKTLVVEVKQIPESEAEAYLQSLAAD
ncbi:hypothetical protein [Paraherbaspirillum soli]|uniref:Uncharacterized protein n=1 Tax=Paraherbaspirillum soli TaxID=631222 RepID=A0ABW0M6J5_9BURK